MASSTEKEEQTMQSKGITKRIQTIMTMRGMTLVDLAKKIPSTDKNGNPKTLANATLSARINGNPSLKSLYEIANALEVKITDLFPDEETEMGSSDKELLRVAQESVVPQTQSVSTTAFCPHCGGKVKVGVVLMGE